MKKIPDYFGLMRPKSNCYKFILTMKISLVLLFCCLLNIYAGPSYSQLSKISLKIENATVEDALKEIENRSEFYFLFNAKLINMDKKVNIYAENEPIADILDDIFGDDVKFIVYDKQIILTPSQMERVSLPASLQQTITVTGTVTDAASGIGMPGVSVVVKGTTVGAATDIEGNFTINVPNNATIVVSFVGYKTVEVPIANQTQLNITLDSDAITLGDVVVTALGIQRETKTLTYSAQQVSGAEVMKAQDMNFMSALSGKAAGLEIKRAASGPGGTTRAILRGNNSFSGTSQPLYVIDGVPMVNRDQNLGGIGGVSADGGDGLSQLNSDDIESITVLKGANAAILYGSTGANGVILITTKKGREGFDVNISSSTMFENVLIWPELQYRYGADGGAMQSWSLTPMDNPSDNFLKDFLRTGVNLVNNITISGGNNRTTAYFSYGNTSSKGIIETNEYIKHNVTFKQSTKLFNDKVTITSNVMLTNETSFNRFAHGWRGSLLNGIYFFPRERDISRYRDEVLGSDGYPIQGYRKFDKDRNLYVMDWFVENHYHSNPWWMMHAESREDNTKRMISSANVDWNIAKGLKFSVRGNYDFARKVYDHRFPAGGNTNTNASGGRWYIRNYIDWLTYFDAILSYNAKFGDFSLNAIAGGSMQRTQFGDGFSVDNGTKESLVYPNIFTLQNMPGNVPVNSTLSSKVLKLGWFAQTSIGFREMIFLDLSGRNDWSSTLAGTGNESYFYPAVGLSTIISQMITLPSFVTFGKVRGSYTTVAKDVNFNITRESAGMDGDRNISYQTTAPFINAKPEMITSIEIGTDWRFLEGRLGFDFTYYTITNKDQFITIPAIPGSGFTNRYMNAGKLVNKGVEILLDAEPVSSNNFSWRTALNFARNVNKIVTIDPNDPSYRVTITSAEGIYQYLVPGGKFGDLWIQPMLKDEQGRLIVNDNQTFEKMADPELVGNLDPDFTLGWNNTFTYKNWSMGFLINGTFGGDVISYGESMFDEFGVSKRSADARDKGYVEINGVYRDGTPVTQMAPDLYYKQIGGRENLIVNYIWDRTNVRVTQFSLTYNVPVRQFNLPLKSASVGFIGQNLFFIYRDAPHDPETAMSTGIGNQGIDNLSLPATRTFGFNLKVNF